ncbi:MAG: RNA-binding domain-containing protein [Candidatus Bathyarchaeia archaeon]|jgi:predicted RNA binding protein with dsRBD fold (UPF0201 family)
MEEISLHVETEINSTESQEKVEEAVRNIFGDVNLQVKPLHKASLLVGEGKGKESLTRLCDLLRREHIRGAARAVFLEGMEKKAIRFCLNKQVAYVGHISFSKENAESPLGPIKVKIECRDPRELVEWLAPRITQKHGW